MFYMGRMVLCCVLLPPLANKLNHCFNKDSNKKNEISKKANTITIKFSKGSSKYLQEARAS